MHTLTTPRLTLRPAHVEDLPTLQRIVQTPGAAEWWGDYEGQEDDDELLSGYTILLEGEIIGWVGYEEETAVKFPSVGLDIMLDPAHHGNGYGPEALRAVIDHFIAAGHHRFTIDPSSGNAKAIHAYESVGFKPIGIAREYEELRAGEKSDALLMDLLARDLE
ncbi:MAG: GNAT family N-acetyltransferase [Thermoleophilaceae bacterium]|nr:GNAT family N-acetyltransferase [Thermoleophilaceae bacterium]